METQAKGLEPVLHIDKQREGEDAAIEEFKRFAPDLLKFAVTRFGGGESFPHLYQEKISNIKRAVEHYERVIGWYQQDYRPRMSEL